MTCTVTPQSLFEKLKHVQTDNPLCQYTLAKCERLSPVINEILQLKKEKNAVILAHSYVHPDIIYTVADHTGDSYGLASIARQTDADTIVFPAVRFMAETAKILNPDKRVIDPNPNGGCSLADSITAETVHELRKQYPQHTFVCYINTTAAVKAACDVCVTSSNVYRIIESLPNEKIYFLPDKLMGQNLQDYLLRKQIKKELVCYSGTCYVHEEFNSEMIDQVRSSYPDLTVLAHPECKPDVVKKADHVCSTTGMVDHVQRHAASRKPFLLLTECGIATRLQVENPDVQLVGSCMMCRYMKSNHLEAICQALKAPAPNQIITIDEGIQAAAKRCLETMF